MTKAQVAAVGNVHICMRHRSGRRRRRTGLAGRSLERVATAWKIRRRTRIVLDLEGLTSLFGTDENIAQELARRVAAIGLAAACGGCREYGSGDSRSARFSRRHDYSCR